MICIDFMEKLVSSECYFRTHWKIYCPGCGGTRALEALLQGKIMESFIYNPIVLMFLGDIILMETFKLYEKSKKEIGKTAEFRIKINSGFLLFIFVFFLFRNYLLYGWGIDVLGDFSYN